MPHKPALLVVVLAASLALAGCSTGGASTTSDTSSAAEPSGGSSAEPSTTSAAGATITGTGYTYVVPEGWGEADGSVASQSDSLAGDLTDDDGFADNVNVILSPAGEVTPDQVESGGADELKNAGATDVTVRDRVNVAGSESAHLSAGFTSSGATYQIEQYYLTNNGQTFVVTFSFSPTVSEADRDAVAQSILATWMWT